MDRQLKKKILVSLRDMELFAQASHDHNPLHVSTSYARTTQFGQLVVFGVLGILKMLAVLEDLPQGNLARFRIDFPGPLFVDQEYKMEYEKKTATRIDFRMLEASRVLLSASFEWDGSRQKRACEFVENVFVPAREAQEVRKECFIAGYQTNGEYSVNGGSLFALRQALGLPAAISDLDLGILLWGSYLVGMELPGRQALFSHFSWTFERGAVASPDPVRFRAQVEKFDSRFARLSLNVNASAGQQLLGHGKIRSLVREQHGVGKDNDMDLYTKDSALAGRVALVIGGSRGLGARIALALAFRGAAVIVNFRNCQDEADSLLDMNSRTSGRIVLARGDAADKKCLSEIAARITEEFGRLDYLICNACPTIQPLSLDLDTVDKMNQYVFDSLALVSLPLAAFIPLLEKSPDAWNVNVSSVYATEFKATHPHYVSAKLAVEGLSQTMARNHPGIAFLILRAPRLEGEINIAAGGEPIVPSREIALRLSELLLGPKPSGQALIYAN